jgi:hypothetical protein
MVVKLLPGARNFPKSFLPFPKCLDRHGGQSVSCSMVICSSFSRDKTARYEALHSPPSSIEVKNAWSYIPIPHMCLNCVHSDNFRGQLSSRKKCCTNSNTINTTQTAMGLHLDHDGKKLMHELRYDQKPYECFKVQY